MRGDVTSADLNAGIQDRATLYPDVRRSRLAPTNPNDLTNAYFASRFAAAYAPYDTDVYYSNAYDASWMTLVGAAWSLLREGAVTGRGIARGFRKLVGGTSFVGARRDRLVEQWRQRVSAVIVGEYQPSLAERRSPG